MCVPAYLTTPPVYWPCLLFTCRSVIWIQKRQEEQLDRMRGPAHHKRGDDLRHEFRIGRLRQDSVTVTRDERVRIHCCISSSHQPSSLPLTNPPLYFSPTLLCSSHQPSSIPLTNPPLYFSPTLLCSSHQPSSVPLTNPPLFLSPTLLCSSHQPSSIPLTNPPL